MVTGFRNAAGADLDTVFAARVSAAGANVGFKNSAGTDLAQLLEPYNGINPLGTATGFKNSAGVDFKDLFATTAGAPANFTGAGASGSALSGTRTGTITVNRDGTVVSTGSTGVTPSAQKSWFTPTYAAAGDSYQIECVITGSGGTITGTNGANVWQALSTAKAWTLSVAGSSGNYQVGTRTFTFRIRRTSDSVVVCTGSGFIDIDVGT